MIPHEDSRLQLNLRIGGLPVSRHPTAMTIRNPASRPFNSRGLERDINIARDAHVNIVPVERNRTIDHHRRLRETVLSGE